MKVFQVFRGFCYWDATSLHPTLESAYVKYAPNIAFVKSPDYVREGWGYDEAETGSARFIEPTPPEGWLYSRETGTLYPDPNYIPVEPDPDPVEVEHT